MSAGLRLFLVVGVVALGSTFQMYHITVVNNPAGIVRAWINDSYAKQYGEPPANLEIWWTLTTSSFMAGAVPGAAMVGYFAKPPIGPRRGLQICGLISVTASVLVQIGYHTAQFPILILARFIFGISTGLSGGLASIFVTQIPPPHLRGVCGGSLTAALGIGQFLSVVITIPQAMGTETMWHIAFTLPGATSLIMFFVLFVAPDPPLQENPSSKAAAVDNERSIRFYRGEPDIKNGSFKNNTTDISNNMNTNDTSSNCQKTPSSERSAIIHILLEKGLRKKLLISCVAIASVSLSGIAPILTYSSTIFSQMGLSTLDAIYTSVALSATFFVVQTAMLWPIERMGRRPLVLVGLCGIIAVLCLMIGLTGWRTLSPTLDHGTDTALSVAAAGCLFGFAIFFSIQSPVPMFLPAELFASCEKRLQGTATTVSYVVFFGVGFILTLVYDPFKSAVGVLLSFVPFVVTTFLCVLYLRAVMPETKINTRTVAPKSKAKDLSVIVLA